MRCSRRSGKNSFNWGYRKEKEKTEIGNECCVFFVGKAQINCQQWGSLICDPEPNGEKNEV